MSDTDLDLLARYTRHHAEDAFAEIVRRHLDLVFSAALRQVRSPQLAEEVAQSPFISLAHEAHRLAPDTILAAWLYQVARRTAANVVRREARRQLREQVATEMNAMNATDADWKHIEPLLDEAMHALDDTDRTAGLLRYFENKSLREVGTALGTSENAAQKRLGRAVERLREYFAKRGVTVGASGLIVVISANAIQAAPIGLAVTISTTAALAGTIITTTATVTASNAVAMTTLQKTLVAATVAILAGVGIYEAQQASDFRTKVQVLNDQQQGTLGQLERLQTEKDRLAAGFQIQTNELEMLRRGRDELLRLRSQAGLLRQELTDLKLRAAQSGPQTNVSKRTWAPGESKLLADWKDAGVTSPESAIETYWWARKTGDTKRLRDLMVFDRVISIEPVSELFARREAGFDAGWFKEGMTGGMRLFSAAISSDQSQLPGVERAKIEVEIMRRPTPENGLPQPPNGYGSPGWFPVKQSYDLVKADGEWKVIGDEHAIKLSWDDEDSNAVAKLLMKLKPEHFEEVRSQVRPQTLRVYEEMKAQGSK